MQSYFPGYSGHDRTRLQAASLDGIDPRNLEVRFRAMLLKLQYADSCMRALPNGILPKQSITHIANVYCSCCGHVKRLYKMHPQVGRPKMRDAQSLSNNFLLSCGYQLSVSTIASCFLLTQDTWGFPCPGNCLKADN